MGPPGCPVKKVVAVLEPDSPKLRGAGKMVKLDCGHIQWEAGFATDVRLGHLHRPCLGGCYQRQRFMGSEYA